ncbi:MAG: hypothetical protein AABO57_24385 [Acidobacteriota bacterium]
MPTTSSLHEVLLFALIISKKGLMPILKTWAQHEELREPEHSSSHTDTHASR